MANMRTLVCDTQVLEIKDDEAIQIEILLNGSEYGFVWTGLGDILYKWGIGCTHVDKYYNITQNQFNWLVSKAYIYIQRYYEKNNLLM